MKDVSTMGNYGEILIYQSDDGLTNVEVKIEDETVWLTQQQIGIAKNNLQEDELKVLNNLVSGYFDLAEINAIEHKPMYMDDYIKQLDMVLSSGNRKLLEGSGTVSHKQAMDKAKSEYRKYQEITLTPVEQAYLENIKELSKTVKKKDRNLRR